jgi:integrase
MRDEVITTYTLIHRTGRGYYAQDRNTGQQKTLSTRDRDEAERKLLAMNETASNPSLAHAVGMAYLSCADPAAATRTWRHVFDQVINLRSGDTAHRWVTASKDKALKSLLDVVLVETRAEQFLTSLAAGTVSTNVYLRRVHNFALDLGWLPRPVIPKRQWPSLKHKKRRGITEEEHKLILAGEKNPERYDYYELLWYTGASQGDMSALTAENIDWSRSEIRFFRKKSGTVTCQKFAKKVEQILRRRPSKGPLFPYLCTVRSGDRATEFAQRCALVGVKGVSLHSYRHAWAKRAKLAGYPERYAQIALGHNSRAIHEHYSGVDEATVPSLEEYEAKQSVRSKTNAPTPIRMISDMDGRWN